MANDFKFVLLFALVIRVVECTMSFCSQPDVRLNTKPAWTFPPQENVYTCADQRTQLHCCSTNYTRITWYVNQNNSGWQEVHISLYFYTESYNQTLVMEYPSLYTPTQWRCVVRGVTYLVNDFTLTVKECDSWKGRPVQLLPTQNKRRVKLMHGENLTQPCETFTGCCDQECNDQGCRMQWWYSSNNSLPTPIPQAQLNYTGTVYEDMTSYMLGMGLLHVLQITNIDGGSYGQYVCVSTNRYGSVNVSFTLEYGSETPVIKKDNLTVLTLSIVTMASLLCVFTIVGVNQHYRWDLTVRLWVRMNCHFLYHHRAANNIIGILSAESDRDLHFCDDLQGYLSRFPWPGYTVIVRADVCPGENVYEALDRMLSCATCLLVIVSPDLLRGGGERLMVNLWSSFVGRAGVKIIYIILEPISRRQWNKFRACCTDWALQVHIEVMERSILVAKKLWWPQEPATQINHQNFYRKLLLSLPVYRMDQERELLIA